MPPGRPEVRLMHSQTRIVARALVTTALSLLLVGLVSHTPIRHLIQVSPAGIALATIRFRAPWAAYAALPVFLFWLLIMVAIWLFLLGLANLVTGTFSPAEIALTVVIGASCAWGTVASLRTPVSTGWIPRSSAAAAFAAMQVAAMWFSLRPGLAAR